MSRRVRPRRLKDRRALEGRPGDSSAQRRQRRDPRPRADKLEHRRYEMSLPTKLQSISFAESHRDATPVNPRRSRGSVRFTSQRSRGGSGRWTNSQESSANSGSGTWSSGGSDPIPTRESSPSSPDRRRGSRALQAGAVVPRPGRASVCPLRVWGAAVNQPAYRRVPPAQRVHEARHRVRQPTPARPRQRTARRPVARRTGRCIGFPRFRSSGERSASAA